MSNTTDRGNGAAMIGGNNRPPSVRGQRIGGAALNIREGRLKRAIRRALTLGAKTTTELRVSCYRHGRAYSENQAGAIRRCAARIAERVGCGLTTGRPILWGLADPALTAPDDDNATN